MATQQITSTFIKNMMDGYRRFGCSFLFKRRTAKQSVLSGLMSSSGNPLWQQKLQSEIAYINSLILEYKCRETGGNTPIGGDRPIDCKTIRPHCEKITSMLNQGMDVSTYLQMLASQYNTTYTIIKDAYIRCCNETTTGGTTPVNIPCDRVPKDFCRKLMTANTQQAVDAIVNSVSSMFNISYQQAFSLLKRCCRENGTGTGTGTDIPCRYVISHGVCEKYMGHMNNGDVQSAMQEVNQFALSEGISTPAAYALVLKCCGDDTTGTGTGTDYGCDRVPRELCIKYLSGIQNNDQLSITSTVNQLVSMLGVSYTQAQALLRKCCRENGTGTGTSTGSDRDDCDIICYKCQDGYPVANKFNGMRTSKSDGSGYIVDCPKGWSSNTNPCGDRPTRPNTSPVRPTIPTRPNVSTVKSGGVGTTSLGGGFGSIPRPNTSPIKFGPSNVPTSQTQVMNNTNIATPMRNYSGGMWLSDNY